MIRFVCLSHKKTSFLIHSLNLAIADSHEPGFQILFLCPQLKPFSTVALVFTPFTVLEVVLLPLVWAS